MLLGCSATVEAVRFFTPDSVERYVAGEAVTAASVSRGAASEETFFLGLRLARGLDLREVWAQFGKPAESEFEEAIAELIQLELLERDDNVIRLTARGRLLSNEVFARFIDPAESKCETFRIPTK
jgi:oxygen-independent coproporphyrinogen-3 oxidase